MLQSRQHELAAKRVAVMDALERERVCYPELSWGYVGKRLAYRNRLRLRITAEGQVAFFNQRKLDACAVLEPGLARLIERVRELARCEPELLRRFTHLEVRSADDDGQGGVCFYPAAAVPEQRLLERLQGIGADVAVLIAGAGPAHHAPCQRFDLAGDVYARVPLDGFLQVNSQVNRALVGAVRALARSARTRRFADLYAGSGNFTLPLLRDGAAGACVELHGSALHALDRACREQGLPPPELRAASAENAAREWHAAGEAFDLVIVDAPRAGVKSGIEQLAALAGRAIALCSCNPVTLARNLKSFSVLGFDLKRVVLFDMFPNTRHVEVLAWLERA